MKNLKSFPSTKKILFSRVVVVCACFFWSLRLNFDPRDRSHHPHFFDPQSTIYDGRVAGEHDFCRPLTAEMLRKEAQKLAQRPYSLSEFNCNLESLIQEDFGGENFSKVEIVGLKPTNWCFFMFFCNGVLYVFFFS